MKHQSHTTTLTDTDVLHDFEVVFDDYTELVEFLTMHYISGKMSSENVLDIAQMFLAYKGPVLPVWMHFVFRYSKFERVTARVETNLINQN